MGRGWKTFSTGRFQSSNAARKEQASELECRDGGMYLRTRHTTDERFMKGEFQLHPEDGAT